jgi:hypothetical protein
LCLTAPGHDVGGDAPRLVAGEVLGRRASSRLVLYSDASRWSWGLGTRMKTASYRAKSAVRDITTRRAAVSSSDAIVKLVGVTDIHHAANNFGLVTLHV